MKMTKARLGSLILVAAISGACASKTMKTGRESYAFDSKKRDDAAYQRALSLAAEDAAELGRKPASNESVGARVSPDFQGLRKELRMVVFPKVSTQAEKTSKATEIEFGAPATYTFHAQRLGKCADIAGQKVKALSNREVFAPVASDRSLGCAAIRVQQTAPKLRPATFSNDLVGTTFYIDSEYRAYGVDTEVAYSRKDIKRFTLKQDPRESLSSGLSLFPIDLPNGAAAAKAEQADIQLPADAYVRNKLKKLGAAPNCEKATVFKYRDTYGNPAQVSWCSGDRWPSVIETNRYLAVIKK